MVSVPEVCPVCGEDVPPNAKVCPHCGACEETGWSEETDVGALDLPDEEFDYDDFVEREFGSRRENPVKREGLSWIWWIAAVLVVLGFLSRDF